MKLYTNESQTAKLIELGFEKPNMALVKAESLCQSGTDLVWRTTNYEQNYSIGELIEMLGVHLSSIYYIGIVWVVNAEGLERRSEELIDALYYMCIKLREEGVI